jgi:hypothetical protein
LRNDRRGYQDLDGAAFQLVKVYVGRILKCEKVADLPWPEALMPDAQVTPSAKGPSKVLKILTGMTEAPLWSSPLAESVDTEKLSRYQTCSA